MGAGISTETYVSNIKCYGELSRQKGHNCYTHVELVKMAKGKGLKRSGTKKELAKRLRIQYVDYKKYSGLYSYMGLYEYRLIHVNTTPRYINGKLENVHYRYCNRIAGMMMEKLIAFASDQEKFIRPKALTLLHTTQKELGEATEDLNFKKSNVKIWKDDIGKIMDKYELEYTDNDLKFLTRVLYSIDRIRNKENSKKFAVISTSMGGAIQYVYPDFFELIKFEGMYRKSSYGHLSVYISPLLGVYDASPTEKKYNSFQRKGYLNQLCLVGIPYIGLYGSYTRPLIYTDDDLGNNKSKYLARCIYVEAPKITLPEECEYLNYFRTGELQNYDNLSRSTNFGFCINNIMLNDHPDLLVPPLPKLPTQMSKWEFTEFFEKNGISNRSLANRFYLKVKDEKYRGHSLSDVSKRNPHYNKYYMKKKEEFYESTKDEYTRYYNGKWTLGGIRGKLHKHPIGPLNTISNIIKTYMFRSKRPFISEDDIKRSLKMTKAYYNEVLNSKDVKVDTEMLKAVMNDDTSILEDIKLPKSKVMADTGIKRLLYLPVSDEDIRKEADRVREVGRKYAEAREKEEARKKEEEIRKEEEIKKAERRKNVREKMAQIQEEARKEEAKKVPKETRLIDARKAAKNLSGDQIVVSPYTDNTLIILGPGTKKYKDIFKKHGASWKRRMKVWMTTKVHRDSLLKALDKAKVIYVDVASWDKRLETVEKAKVDTTPKVPDKEYHTFLFEEHSYHKTLEYKYIGLNTVQTINKMEEDAPGNIEILEKDPNKGNVYLFVHNFDGTYHESETYSDIKDIPKKWVPIDDIYDEKRYRYIEDEIYDDIDYVYPKEELMAVLVDISKSSKEQEREIMKEKLT